MHRLLSALVLVGAAATAASAESLLEEEPPPQPSPWDRGRLSFGLSLGTQSAFGERYFGVGAGAGYHVLDGLSLNLSAAHWFGGTPSVSRITPEVRYVALVPFVLKPYAGVFFNHWFVGDNFGDVDTVGGRLGVMLDQGGGLILGGGVAVERTLTTCDECVEIYPDIIIALSF